MSFTPSDCALALASALASMSFGVAAHEADGVLQSDARQAQPATLSAEPLVPPPTGVMADSSLQLVLRNYADFLSINGVGTLHGWVQGAQANFISGFSGGEIGLGVDASLFGAIKLDGGRGVGDMVHLSRSGGGENRTGWAYLGGYAVKARFGKTVVKYGLQQMENPFLESKDNRALPPTFRGVAAVSELAEGMTFEAGSFDAVSARGRTGVQALSSAYGGTPIERLSYMGTNAVLGSSRVLLYVAQARNVWKQLYASARHSVGTVESTKWTATATMYRTRDQGASLQGPIDGKAYSLALAAQQGASEVALSFQHVMGDQYLDYVQEANGLYLANGMVADYNAPREKSVQLRYLAGGADFGVPGMDVLFWGIAGRSKAPATLFAPVPEASWRDAYWRGGKPVHGAHHELGIKTSYAFNWGEVRGINIAFIALVHRGSAHYVEPSEREYRLTVNVPIKLF
ncbi:OprD family outer membrane porin [Massilia cavernae]|uniref:Outer membrane porin, OprD family n=1 Tax=Massilia cavernae TaxID=2320864 RepID=A0A418XRG3_9BURK|nr:OprD family outer membrane porin [Massilia cavernae]RJG15047.1 outer membrane porin, OprD family [Massilia cavernae]